MFETMSIIVMVVLFAVIAADTVDRVYKYYEDKFRDE